MVAYVEACMHAVGAVRVFSEQNVRPDFVRFLEEQAAPAASKGGPGQGQR
jgi:hypothetical protein